MVETIGISAPDAVKGVKDGKIQLVDVRLRDEAQAQGMAKGAICIPLEDLQTLANPASSGFVAQLAERPVLAVYCGVGLRSAAATQMLLGLGHRHVRDLGPLHAWQMAGGEMDLPPAQ